MIRHFTSTAFVARPDAVLLHWHRKVRAWLPPGGHVEPNEDPVQTVLREVREEIGVPVRLLSTSPRPDTGGIRQIQLPVAILEEDIEDPEDGPHQHIDFIYFAMPVHGVFDAPDGWRWFSRDDLVSNRAVVAPTGEAVPPPEDVVALGLAAMTAAGDAEAGYGRRAT